MSMTFFGDAADVSDTPDTSVCHPGHERVPNLRHRPGPVGEPDHRAGAVAAEVAAVRGVPARSREGVPGEDRAREAHVAGRLHVVEEAHHPDDLRPERRGLRSDLAVDRGSRSAWRHPAISTVSPACTPIWVAVVSLRAISSGAVGSMFATLDDDRGTAAAPRPR